MPTFAQIQEEISAMLDINVEELNDEQLQNLELYLDELASQEEEKIDSFAQFVTLQTAQIEACKAEAKRLTDKAKTAEKHLIYLKTRYLEIMQSKGLKKIQGKVYTLSMKESIKAIVPVNAILDLKDTHYVRKQEIIEPDKIAIKKALQQGIDVSGCYLEINYNLQIK